MFCSTLPVINPITPREGLHVRARLTPGRRTFASDGKPKGVRFGATQIGLHAGPALVGNFGGERLFDYAAYGDAINTASRLEAANKLLGTRLCISEAVASGAADFIGRPVGDLVLRGRSETLRAYEPLTKEAFSSPLTARYSAAFGKLSVEDPSVMPAFAALFGEQPDDPLAGFHLRRLLNGEKGTRIESGLAPTKIHADIT